MEGNISTTSVVNESRDWHDTIGEGLLVTVTGISVVFSVLIIMFLFITFFKKIDEFFTSKESKKEKAARESISMKPKSEGSIKVSGDIDDDTIVVICAAVAAATNNQARVHSIVLPKKAKRGGDWALQTRSALQRSHIFK